MNSWKGGDHMAVIVNPLDTKMVLAFQVGTTEDGKAIIKKKTYSKVKSDSTNEDFHEVAAAIASLQTNLVDDIYRDDLMKIEEA